MQNSEEVVNTIYRPLQKKDREVRLVVLEPATERSMPITCRLEVVKLCGEPIYEALSWNWGDPNDNDEIILEGRRWLVRRNLVTALRYLRYEDRTRIMWIDALSINQNGWANALREREHQIQLMKYVYSVACHVVVWIGVPDDGMAGFVQKFLVGPRSLLSALTEEGVDGFNQSILYSWRIRRFPWWRRLWVLQEVALASDVFVQLGSAWISFDRLLSELAISQHFLLRFFERVENPAFRLTAVALTRPNIPSPHTVYELREQSRRQATQYRTSIKHGEGAPDDNNQNVLPEASKTKAFREFANYIVRYRYYEASVPLDKLYALLGLVPDLVGLELNPRYDEEVVSMYRRTTVHIIRSSNSLYLLSQAQVPMLSESPYATMLPSWVPDWKAKPGTNHGWSGAPFRELREELFDASSGATCEVATRDDDCSLGLQGVMIDAIKSSRQYELPRPENFKQWWHKTREWRELAGVYEFQRSSQTRKRISSDDFQEHIQLSSIAGEETVNNHEDHYVGGCKLKHAYWRTLLHNTIPYEDKSIQGRTFSSVYEPADPHLAAIDRQHLAYCPGEFLEKCLNLSEDSDVDLQVLFSHLERVTECSNFFITNDGFMGIGTNMLRPGDQVWVLAGGSHSFILREDDLLQGHYLVVGEAYVERIMMSGDINKPYASRVRRQQKMGHENAHVDVDIGIWEELWLR